MEEAVVSFLIEKVWDFLSRESEHLQGVDEKVDELRLELSRLQSLLNDADAKKHESERVKNFLEEVKEILYDAEDIIETFLIEQERGKEKGIKNCVRRLSCCLRDRRRLGLGMIERMKSFGIQQIIVGTDRSLSFQDRQREEREIRQTFPNNPESDLVGMDQSVEELVSHLVDNDNIQVVSITGMGGIGKTTLAKHVFHHDIVRRHFEGFTWFCVSKTFTRKDVWQRILNDLTPNEMEISHMDEYTLQGKLFDLLKTGRYLVVLDDVWREQDWDRIKSVFPRTRGWKMLLTSRNEGVGLHADATCFTFRPRILTSTESWTLCWSVAFPRRNETEFRVDEEIEAMGKEMVMYCGGLPLAIKVLGGLLAKKHTFLEWKKVSDAIKHHIVGRSGRSDNDDLVSRVLSLSYEDLPRRLKHCFLFLALYPENFHIAVNKLSYYWAAEGILTSFYDGDTILESGEGCLEELVRRNMVIVEKHYLSSRILYCQMHDMMREVCLSKAKEENFVQIIKVPRSTTSLVNVQSCSTSRRLAVHCGNVFDILERNNKKKVRSLLFFGVDRDVWRQTSLPLLRVLDLYKVQFEGGKLPSSIGELVHLRFLSLLEAVVSLLPTSLRKLKLLLYLNLTVNGKSIHVPNVLKEMLELRYLQLPGTMHDQTLLELGNLVNLETLCFFSTKHTSVTDLIHMTRLRILSVCIRGECSFETLSSSLCEMRDLKKLTLVDSRGEDRVAYHGGEFVMNIMHLNYLGLSIHMPWISDLQGFPPHIAN
ncbi:hypothetical protein CARUB_v10022213mg, partial [Capsella rubella]